MKKIMIILGLIFLLFSQGFGADSGAPMRKHNLLDGNWHGDTTRSTPNTNDVIKWDGTKWISGSGTPGGSNTDIQYNNNGTFGGYSFSVDSSLGTSDTTIPSQKAIKTYIDESYFVKQTQTPTALACAIATSPNALALTTGIDYYTLTSDNAACTITGFGLVANGNSFEVGIIATVIIDATGSNIVLKGGRDRIAVNGDTLYCRGRADNKAYCTLVSGGVSTDDIATTGTIDGRALLASANGATVAVQSGYYIATGTSPFIVPTPSSADDTGKQYCFKQSNNATNALTVIPVHESGVQLEKTDGTGYCDVDDKLVSGGGKTDKLCIVSIDGTHYDVFSSTGTWTCTAH